MFNYFVMGTRRKTQDAMTGRPVYSGDSEKDSLGNCHAGAASANWQNSIHQANPCSSVISLLLPSVAILFARKKGIFSTQAAQGRVTPLHVTVGPVWPVLGGEGKSKWPIWASLPMVSSPLSLHILPENQHIAKNLSSQ